MTEPSTSVPLVCDVLVVGSGAGGMSAAISAALCGLSVIVAEKHTLVGGTTARSGGMIWVPCNPLSVADRIDDSLDRARQYIRAETGRFYDSRRVDAYLESAPRMIETYRTRTSAMRFVRNDFAADNHPNLPGALEKGRTVTVPPFDARELGSRLRLLSAPIEELTFLGMQIQPGKELGHFFAALKSWQSFRFVAIRLLAHCRDMLLHGRTMRLANGNALAARLFKSALDLGVTFMLARPVRQVHFRDGNVGGAALDSPNGPLSVVTRRGVVLACGGFPHDPVRRKTHSPIGELGAGRYALGPRTNVGDGLTLGESAGGCVETHLPNTISWTPVSRFAAKDGTYRLFPHSFDRNKPGFIAVARSGRRFCSEGAIGNDFVREMVRECAGGEVEAFLITDHRTLRKYGMGMVRPSPLPLVKHLRSGYLVRGQSLAELATRIGINAEALGATVCTFNENAVLGLDPAFGRGQSALERRLGDAEVKPNPCLAPIKHAPFYAIRIHPGDFSTLAGLRTDAQARVLDASCMPIGGLYAVGNDASSLFAGNSPAGGSTLGPALTFGFIAGTHLAQLEGEIDESVRVRKHTG